MLKNIKTRILIVSCLVFTFAAPFARAVGFLPANESGSAPPNSCNSPNGCGNYSLNDMMSVAIIFVNGTLGMIGAAVLLYFVYGGVMLIISAGNEEKVSKGKQILLNAINGLLIVLAAYVIVQFTGQLLGAKVGMTLPTLIK